MSSDCNHSVLPIMRRAAGNHSDLLGTGLVLSWSTILTCAHIFENRFVHNGAMKLPESVVVFSNGIALQPSRIEIEETLDLCCMHFNEVVKGGPLRLVRSTRLAGMKMIAVGYVPGPKGPHRNVTRGLSVIHELQSEESGWLQFGQLRGGLPRGFSGGPVIAKTKAGLEIVGLLQLGGERAATSRFIGVDPIASFLVRNGFHAPIGNLKREYIPKDIRAMTPKSDVEINDSVVIQSSNIGGSVITNQNLGRTARKPRMRPGKPANFS